MHRLRTLRTALVTVTGLVASITVTAPAAHAGGFLTRFAGEESYATTDEAAAAYYNPAGLAMRKGSRASVEAGVGYRHSKYSRDPGSIDNVLGPGDTGSGTPQDAISANSGDATLTNPVILPFAGVATDLGVPNLGVGLAVSVPFGGQAEWDKNDEFAGSEYPGAVDGPQRWVIIEGEQRALYLTGALAYRLHPTFSLGAGVNFIMHDVNIVRARTVQGTDDLVNGTGGVVEGRSLLTVSGQNLSVGAGLMWEPTPALRVGLSYQSQPNFGEMTLKGTLTNKFGSADTAVTDVDMVTALPDIVRLGVRIAASPRLEVRLAGDYQRWSALEKQCFLDSAVEGRNCALAGDGSAMPEAKGIVANIPRYWEDSWGVRGGLSYWAANTVRVQGSLGYDRSPVPDDMLEAGLLDLDKVVVAFGARFLLSGNMELVTGWTQVFYFAKDTTPTEPLAAPSRVPGNAGHYEQSVGLFQLALDVRF
jgi:long-chain fatty acid transport protein